MELVLKYIKQVSICFIDATNSILIIILLYFLLGEKLLKIYFFNIFKHETKPI